MCVCVFFPLSFSNGKNVTKFENNRNKGGKRMSCYEVVDE